MRYLYFVTSAILTMLALLLMNCCPENYANEEKDIEIHSPQPVLLSLGDDVVITSDQEVVFLSASINSNLTTEYSYQWYVVHGAPLLFTNPESLTTSVTGFISGTYAIGFTATSANDISTSVSLTLTVNEVNDIPLHVELGDDIELTLPQNSISITSIVSSSVSSISYQWEVLNNINNLEIETPNSRSSTFTGFVFGEFVIQITVVDEQGSSATASLTVNVFPEPNAPPVVSIVGDLFSITLPQNSITLTASSTDVDGTIESCYWEILNNEGSTEISSPENCSTVITGFVEGEYIMKITVVDDDGASASSTQTILVLPQPNQAPELELGSDISLMLPQANISITASATDVDGSINSYLWEIKNERSEIVAYSTNQNLDATSLSSGVYQITLTVIDDFGDSSTDSLELFLLPPDDRKILWQWYQDGLTTNKQNLNWFEKNQSNAPLIEWTGVNEVDENNRLVRLELIETFLGGAIIPDIWKLTELRHLSLRKNTFNQIPLQLFDLSNLEVLSFSENDISIIPKEIANLTKLKDFFMSNNRLQNSSIPNELWELTQLQRISFLGNQLTYIPHELGFLVNLTWLELYRNQLTGIVPESLSNLTKLTLLRLYDNPNLTGSLPGNLCQTNVLEISNTDLNCN